MCMCVECLYNGVRVVYTNDSLHVSTDLFNSIGVQLLVCKEEMYCMYFINVDKS